MRTAHLFIILVISQVCNAGDVWLFLKDGTVGLGDPGGASVEVKLADGSKIKVAKEEIRFQRTREQVDAAVTTMVADVVRGEKLEEHSKRFVVMRSAATPKLLEVLKNPDPRFRLTALFALQYSWAPQALEPVLKALEESDADVQKIAWTVLTRNVPEPKLAERVKHLADDDDLANAARVFELVDKDFPDESLKRVRRLLKEPAHWSEVFPRLSHYLSPDLTAETLPILDSNEAAQRRGAVIALIAQLASSATVRTRVQRLLTDKDAEVREIAAEYFTWLGTRDDLPAIAEATKIENDVYTRAALAAATKTIESRAQLWVKKASAAAELGKLKQGDAIEPTFVYEVHEHKKKADYRQRAFQLQEILGAASGNLELSRDYLLNAASPPVAQNWTPPIRDYYDPTRKSFGYCVPKTYTAFVGSVHIGDDCGWGKELRTVIAPAPGVVRSVSHIFSWGFIAVIEHKTADGEFCSIYAHLSPMLHIKPGDIVAVGQKIGSMGRNHTVENGGYKSHCHFGIHRGAYEQGDWVHGYISQDDWKNGADGWLDPQEFLKAHGAK